MLNLGDRTAYLMRIWVASESAVKHLFYINETARQMVKADSDDSEDGIVDEHKYSGCQDHHAAPRCPVPACHHKDLNGVFKTS